MGQQSLIYAFVARGTVILAEYTEFSGNFTSIASQCLQKLPASNNKFTYNCDGHTFNYLVDSGFTYCVVAVESVGRQVPIAFLERVKEDFTKRYGGGKAATAAANSLSREFGPKLKEQMQYCIDHPEEISELAKVKAQVSEVKGVMMENIEKVLDRGEKIELLVDKTENLRSQLGSFAKFQYPGPFRHKSMAAKEPVILTEKDEMREWSRRMRSQGKTIGLVPTMGYLHQGHLSLVEEAHKHVQLIVVSIYVNPGQFSPSEDLSTYPSDFHGDILKLMSVPGGVDAVFNPRNLYDYSDNKEKNKFNADNVDSELSKNFCYNKGVVSCVEEKGVGHQTWVRVERLERGLCGNSRPVFFRGVATVITKLFNIVEPDVAVFGKKDYQQWRIIQRMVRDLDFGIEIVGSDVVRDSDGLALSSRNVHLSPEEREKALSIRRSLLETKSAAEMGQVSCRVLRDSVIQAITQAGGRIDYVEIVEQDSLQAVEEIKNPVVFCIAAWFGKVRLIDNMEIAI